MHCVCTLCPLRYVTPRPQSCGVADPDDIGGVGGQVRAVPDDIRGMSCIQPWGICRKCLWLLYIQPVAPGIRSVVSASFHDAQASAESGGFTSPRVDNWTSSDDWVVSREDAQG